MSVEPSLELSPAAVALFEHLQAGRLRLEIRLVLDQPDPASAASPTAAAVTPDLLTHNEAADYLRIGRSTLYDLRRKGAIRVSHLGGRVVVQREELDRYVAGCREPGRTLPLPLPLAGGRR